MNLDFSFDTLRSALRSVAAGGPANLLGLLLVVAVVAPFVAYGVPAVIGAEESYVVLSGSMEPELSPGDVIFVYAVDPGSIQAGDVVTYATGGSDVPTTHRVTEVIYTDDVPSGVLLNTKGDANEDPDPAPRPAGDVVGRVPAVSLPVVGEVFLAVPLMGYVIRFVNTGVGFVLLVALPIILFVANEGWRIATRSEPDPPAAAHVDGGVSSVSGVESTQRTGTASESAVTGGATIGQSSGPTPAPDIGVGFDRPGLDLTVTAGVLALVTAYTVAVATLGVTVWSVAAVVASVGGLVLAVAARFVPIPNRDADEVPVDTDSIDNDGGTDGIDHDSDTDGTHHEADEVPGDDASGPGYVVIGGDAGDGFAVGVLDLTVATGVLGLTTLYAARVALADPTGWSVGAAVATFGAFAFAVGLRRMALQPVPEPADTAPASESAAVTPGDALRQLTGENQHEPRAEGRIVRASVPAVFAKRPTISVGSRAELLDYAAVVNHLVIEDADTGTYYLPDGDMVYRADPAGDGEPASADRPVAVGDLARNGATVPPSQIAAEADAPGAQENS